MNGVFRTRAGLCQTHEQELPDGKFNSATEQCSQRYCSYNSNAADDSGSSRRSGFHRSGGSAGEWLEAVPIGNGRLGGMVYGGVTTERIGLNEDTLWSGGRTQGL